MDLPENRDLFTFFLWISFSTRIILNLASGQYTSLGIWEGMLEPLT
jgi:hypothetical protein